MYVISNFSLDTVSKMQIALFLIVCIVSGSLQQDLYNLDYINDCLECDLFGQEISEDLPNATEYGALCLSSTNCLDFLGPNSICKNNVCNCNENYRWYKGSCTKYIEKDQPCSETDLCLDGNDYLALTCYNGRCQCSDGYYDRGIDCRIRSEVNNDCAIDMDCFNKTIVFVVISSYCKLGTCIKYDNVDETEENIGQINENIDSIFSSVSSSTWESDCKAVISNLTENECQQCHNTQYLNSLCVCQAGFFLHDGHCIAELGVRDPYRNITNDDDCLIKPGRAYDGICYCKKYWFQSSTNRECKKTTLQWTTNCMDNDWCKAMGPYAYCSTATQTCQCINNEPANETNFLCEKPENLTGICLQNDDCPIYEECLNTKCQCIDGFYKDEQNDICLPKIGSSCQIRNCSMENAICSDDLLCECANSTYVTNGFLCLEPAAHLNESCSLSKQCENIPHSDCLPDRDSDHDDRQCLCEDDYLDVKGTCYLIKNYGSPCSTKFNCTVILGDTFQCRNSLCQCPINWKLDRNKTICVSSATRNYVSLSFFVLIVILEVIL